LANPGYKNPPINVEKLSRMSIMDISIRGGLMKKNWIFIILSLAVLFSLGFLPTPGNNTLNSLPVKPTGSSQASLSVANNTKHTISVWLYGIKTQKHYSFWMSSERGAKKINVVPDIYQVNIYYQDSVECKPMKMNVKITTQAKIKLACVKSGFKDSNE
jgi:hypothetical protein